MIKHAAAKFVLAGAMMAGISHAAQATTINFNGLAGTNMPGNNGVSSQYTQFLAAPATVSGFIFQSTSYEYFIGTAYSGSDLSNIAYNGTDYVMGYGNLTASKVGGGTFSLSSFDLAEWDQNSSITNIILTTSGPSGPTTQSLALSSLNHITDNDGNDFTHFALSGYNNVVSFTIAGNDLGYIAMDNLVVDAAGTVPEPASLVLLGLGLAGLGFGRRKKA